MRSTVSDRKVMRVLRADMEVRAREALAAYSIIRRKYDDPDYPFAKPAGQRSVRDPASQSVSNIPGGIRIAVTAKAAEYEEFGNDSRGTRRFIYPKNAKHLSIPLRPGAVLAIDPRTNRPVLRIQKVHTYEGRHLLEKSVRSAFGLPFRR